MALGYSCMPKKRIILNPHCFKARPILTYHWFFTDDLSHRQIRTIRKHVRENHGSLFNKVPTLRAQASLRSVNTIIEVLA